MGEFPATNRRAIAATSSRHGSSSSSRQAYTAAPVSPSTIVDPWVIDSGASHHVTSDMGNMSLQSDYGGTDQLMVGNGTTLPITHLGHSILTPSSVAMKPLHLKHILCVPKIAKNLLSVSKLTRDNDVFVEFYRNCFFVKTLQGQILLKGNVENGLYCLPRQPESSVSVRSSPRAFLGERTSLECWHHRLAHPHESILRRLVSSHKLPVSCNKLAKVCSSCQLGKSRRLHLPSRQGSSAKAFDLVHSDVWGPAPTSSLSGCRYYVSFVDDYSKFVWVYFLHNKSQVHSIVQLFLEMVSTQFSTKIKAFQTDWGGEYRNVSNMLQQKGITHQISCPYTPEQNGSSERCNRVIVEKGLALLAHSHLPSQFWERAFHTVVYLHNRTITPILAYKSPFEFLYEKVPDYGFLKSFGCLCFPYLRPYNHNKLECRSLPCVFIGYSPKHKGYMCYHVPTSRVYISRYVVFDESSFPYLSQTQLIPKSSHTSPSLPLSLLQDAASSTLTPSASPPLSLVTPTPPSPPSPVMISAAAQSPLLPNASVSGDVSPSSSSSTSAAAQSPSLSSTSISVEASPTPPFPILQHPAGSGHPQTPPTP